jgi:mannose-6-phosphate isomerase-like protein (cupin superfamily)
MWLRNAATGEVAHFNLLGDRRIDVDLWLQPGAAVARAHIHDRLTERFEVLDGEVGFLAGGSERVVRPGDGVVAVPAGTLHDWWNAGAGTARVRVEIEGDAAARFVAMIETFWSLGTLGRVNAEGMPDPLWLIAVAREYRDVIRFTQPPAPVQRVLFPPLAALARRTSRDPLAAELHGPTAPCALADPGDDGLAALLAEPVGTRAARGRAAQSRL